MRFFGHRLGRFALLGGVVACALSAHPRTLIAQRGQPPVAEPKKIDACTLLTNDEVKKATGNTDAGTTPPAAQEISSWKNLKSSCVFDGGGEGTAHRYINVTVTPGYSQRNFDGKAKFRENIGGVGEGTLAAEASHSSTITAKVGDYELEVVVSALGEPGTALRPLALALAKAAAARIHE